MWQIVFIKRLENLKFGGFLLPAVGVRNLCTSAHWEVEDRISLSRLYSAVLRQLINTRTVT